MRTIDIHTHVLTEDMIGLLQKEAPKVAPRVAPELGEHTDEVLRAIGFDATQIDGLRAGGAIPRPKERAAVA